MALAGLQADHGRLPSFRFSLLQHQSPWPLLQLQVQPIKERGYQMVLELNIRDQI